VLVPLRCPLFNLALYNVLFVYNVQGGFTTRNFRKVDGRPLSQRPGRYPLVAALGSVVPSSLAFNATIPSTEAGHQNPIRLVHVSILCSFFKPLPRPQATVYSCSTFFEPMLPPHCRPSLGLCPVCCHHRAIAPSGLLNHFTAQPAALPLPHIFLFRFPMAVLSHMTEWVGAARSFACTSHLPFHPPTPVPPDHRHLRRHHQRRAAPLPGRRPPPAALHPPRADGLKPGPLSPLPIPIPIPRDDRDGSPRHRIPHSGSAFIVKFGNNLGTLFCAVDRRSLF